MKRVSVDADSSVTADQLIKVLAGVGYEAHELDAGLLSATGLIDDIAIDKYAFVRNAYLQRRRSLVYDGNPPDEEEVDDMPMTEPAPAAPAASAAPAVAAPARAAPAAAR